MSLIGLKLALEKQNQAVASNTGIINLLSSNVSDNVTEMIEAHSLTHIHVQLQDHGEHFVLSCEVESGKPNHSVHIVCPMMSPRCFENCKRICEPTGCQLEPSLRRVNCIHHPQGIKGQINIRRFEYWIDKYDRNITGIWSCDHANIKSNPIEVLAMVRTPTTTTTTTTMKTTVTSSTSTSSMLARLATKEATTERSGVRSVMVVKLPVPDTHHGLDVSSPPRSDFSSHSSQFYPTSLENRNFVGSENITPVLREEEREASFDSQFETFLTFFASKTHFVLAFLVLLALSLITNVAFCFQLLRFNRQSASMNTFQLAKLAVAEQNETKPVNLRPGAQTPTKSGTDKVKMFNRAMRNSLSCQFDTSSSQTTGRLPTTSCLLHPYFELAMDSPNLQTVVQTAILPCDSLYSLRQVGEKH
ncbi:hypothetical protein EG68_02630 [Paragonimus skrjabini miyazakii]|uniref:Uncharacterized protein n=1 Tax=Paragonimus skrjabini miyazakii TaxID=59628 RepID=A0A8S9Z4R8_9TREM|nr:hypothetical protein EG68_02630 [Paragonimus skrjabini miyazakii]